MRPLLKKISFHFKIFIMLLFAGSLIVIGGLVMLTLDHNAEDWASSITVLGLRVMLFGCPVWILMFWVIGRLKKKFLAPN